MYSSYVPRVWKTLRRYGPKHLMLTVRQDNEERQVPACGLWCEAYHKDTDGDLWCQACRKKAGL
jgi:hypothetical protein